MTRGQYIAMLLIGAVAMMAYLQIPLDESIVHGLLFALSPPLRLLQSPGAGWQPNQLWRK